MLPLHRRKKMADEVTIPVPTPGEVALALLKEFFETYKISDVTELIAVAENDPALVDNLLEALAEACDLYVPAEDEDEAEDENED